MVKFFLQTISLKAMFWIIRSEEKYIEKYMNDNTAIPNVTTSITVEDQRLLQSHTDRMELVHISKNSEQQSEIKLKDKYYGFYFSQQ